MLRRVESALMVQEISPADVAQLRSQPNAPQLIDVRESWEFAIASIAGAQLQPLGQIGEWAAMLDKDAPYVVVCHHGGRSAMACQLLQSLGFKQVKNLTGGIDAWSQTVDPTVPRY
jgi:rhodanese-related sulfurtransferase